MPWAVLFFVISCDLISYAMKHSVVIFCCLPYWTCQLNLPVSWQLSSASSLLPGILYIQQWSEILRSHLDTEVIKPDNKQVSAMLAMKPLVNAKDLQSFLSLMNYLTRYSSKLATFTALLSELTKREIAWLCISTNQTGNIVHGCAKILWPKGRYNHSDRHILEGVGSCPTSTWTTNVLRFKGPYWDNIERETLRVV